MAKRQTDTEKWRKQFLRGLKGPYKLLWIYLCDNVDHSGIWHVNFEIAQIEIGKDMKVSEEGAIEAFGEKVIPFDDGEKWFLPSFVEFQYGEDLEEKNRVHKSVISRLQKYGFWDSDSSSLCLRSASNKPLISPLEGTKDKEKDKEKDKNKERRGCGGNKFEDFWNVYPKRVSKGQAEKVWQRLNPGEQLIATILQAVERAKTSEKWRKDGGQFIPYPATWLNARGWEDEIEESGIEAFRREAEEEAREQNRVS